MDKLQHVPSNCVRQGGQIGTIFIYIKLCVTFSYFGTKHFKIFDFIHIKFLGHLASHLSTYSALLRLTDCLCIWFPSIISTTLKSCTTFWHIMLLLFILKIHIYHLTCLLYNSNITLLTNSQRVEN